MFKLVTLKDLTRVEGVALPQIAIEDKLVQLGGGGWNGHTFKVNVLKNLGYDVNHEPDDQTKIQVYNQIAQSLNLLGNKVSAQSLCKDLHI